jgi:hypothetical protein
MILLGACVTMKNAEVPDVVLLRAKIESLGEVREIPSQGDEVYIGAWVSIRLSSVKPLIGQFGLSHAEVELEMTSMPRADELKDVYVLGRKLPDGSLEALQWNYVTSGLCIQRETAKVYHIEDDLMRLRQIGSVNWNSDCDW